MDKIKPNFFIVGQPKCGTSFISQALNEHPEIFFLQFIEPHYFAKDIQKEADKHQTKIQKLFFKKSLYPIRKEKDYLKLFKKNKIIGEKSTNYLYSKNAAKEIYNFNPEAKIVIILRNPKTYIPSLHRECIKSSNENLDLQKALEVENQRKTKKKFLKGVQVPSLLYYSQRIKYVEQIKRFEKYFPKSQIKIMFYEDLKNNNNVFFKEILQFLEVEKNNITTKNLIKNEKKEIRNKFSLRVFSFLNKYYIYSIPKLFLPTNIYYKIKHTLVNLCFKNANSQTNSAVEKFIQELSYPEIKKLEKHLQVDLKNKWEFQTTHNIDKAKS